MGVPSEKLANAIRKRDELNEYIADLEAALAEREACGGCPHCPTEGLESVTFEETD